MLLPLEPMLTPLATAVASLLTALGALGAASPPESPLRPPTVADTPAAAVGGPWVSPVGDPPVVLEPFDPPAENWLPGHRGVDLLAVPGDSVHAAGAGIVVFAGPVAGRGVVVVLHPDGRTTTYEPLSPAVAVGDEVSTGESLGTLATGSGHCGALPPCLHWGLRSGDTYLDPLLLLDAGRPRLLPLLPWGPDPSGRWSGPRP